jgi:hypothetical protein
MSDELAVALSEVINREANRTLRRQIEEVFRNFEVALAQVCREYDCEVPHNPSFAEAQREFRRQVFAATSEAAKLQATEAFIRKVST